MHDYGTEHDDEFFDEEGDILSLDGAIEPVDEFVQGCVDPEDLATGFDATLPMREIDVDEDTQGETKKSIRQVRSL